MCETMLVKYDYVRPLGWREKVIAHIIFLLKYFTHLLLL